MKYQGGKTRLAKYICPLILQYGRGRSTYIEPFLGSAAIMSKVAAHFSVAIGNDIVPDIAALWSESISGTFEPPVNLSREKYQDLKNAPPSALRGFAGAGCSFAGKWFGGYASGDNRNFAQEASKSVTNRAATMKHVRVTSLDYEDLSNHVSDRTVVYADPPYAGTTGYAGAGAFDHDRFWRVMGDWVNRGAVVLVSEYSAPENWTEVWSHERHTSTALNNTGARAVDRLFVKGAA